MHFLGPLSALSGWHGECSGGIGFINTQGVFLLILNSHLKINDPLLIKRGFLLRKLHCCQNLMLRS